MKRYEVIIKHGQYDHETNLLFCLRLLRLPVLIKVLGKGNTWVGVLGGCDGGKPRPLLEYSTVD